MDLFRVYWLQVCASKLLLARVVLEIFETLELVWSFKLAKVPYEGHEQSSADEDDPPSLETKS